jgi:hypothetical protein
MSTNFFGNYIMEFRDIVIKLVATILVVVWPIAIVACFFFFTPFLAIVFATWVWAWGTLLAFCLVVGLLSSIWS